MIKFLLIFLLIQFTQSQENKHNYCKNEGCKKCEENDICSQCKEGYDSKYDDCEECQFYLSSQEINETNKVYIPIENECVDITSEIEGNTFERVPIDVEEIVISSTITKINTDLSNVIPSIPPCRDTHELNDYQYGKWYLVTLQNSSTMNIKDIEIINLKTNKIDTSKELFIQVAKGNEESVQCLTTLPLINTNSSSITVDTSTFYLFVSVTHGKDYKIQFSLSTSSYQQIKPSLIIDGKDYLKFIHYNHNQTSFGKEFTMTVGENNLIIHKMNCIKGIHRGILIKVITLPFHTILLDTKISNSFHYVEEFDPVTFKCKTLHIGKKGGLTTTEGSYNGVLFGIYSEKVEEKYYFMTIDYDPLTLRIQIPCKNKCNQDKNQGQCVISAFRCFCSQGFGYEDCSQLCYYNGKFLDNSKSNQCYLGRTGCNKECQCEEGYTYKDNLCVSKQCR